MHPANLIDRSSWPDIIVTWKPINLFYVSKSKKKKNTKNELTVSVYIFFMYNISNHVSKKTQTYI